LQTKEEMGAAAAKKGAALMKDAIDRNGSANILLATGLSQVPTISRLVEMSSIDWSRVTAFHLDEYVGIEESHPASFKKYLKERFEQKLPSPLAAFYYVEGNTDKPEAECERLSQLISGHPIDVAFVGIGENGHLAFNDPPADFETTRPYIVVDLDAACRRQQVGEGWFSSVEDVPKQAISISIKQIMASSNIIASVPDERKADAVKCSVEGPVTNMCPASIMQQHAGCDIYLDKSSASRLATA
jgi:glucosamine-6-phosphate deaminase